MTLGNESAEKAMEGGGLEALEKVLDSPTEVNYLELTTRAYDSSTDYLTAHQRFQWERNIANFKSRHPDGSKYYSDAYLHRSRLFRPKTRSSIRGKEAAFVTAMFSTKDALVISAEDESNRKNVETAKVMHEVVNYRLRKSIPWFKISVGAFQDATVMGDAIGHVYWHYEELVHKKTRKQREYDAETGEAPKVDVTTDEVEVIKDEPAIALVPLENIRLDPGADWVDPINSSPYIIHMMPMYIVDVLDRMTRVDSKTGQPTWKKLSVAEIRSANTITIDTDSVRRARENSRHDPKSDQTGEVNEHQIVWVFRNIMRFPGEGDYVWYTLGVNALLTDPVPLREVYHHNIRPYVCGHSVIEAHRVHPASLVELGQDIQAGTNNLHNQRFDNITQVLNKRYFVRRGATVDLRSLRRNVPGSITLMDDIDRDVEADKPGDVTSSSFQEQNLFNADFDEITGTFSSGSVGTNRELGDTVGGMRMLKDPSNSMTEYIIRTFVETFVKAIMFQLVALERVYETNEVIVAAAGRSAKIDKAPAGTLIKRLKRVNMDVDVSMGMGVTDPQARVGRVLFGLEAIGKIVPQALKKLDEEEIVSEVLGTLGYQDGSRFFLSDQDMQKKLKAQPPPPNPEIMKIEAATKNRAADREQERLIWEGRIMSDERKKAAELSVKYGEGGAKYNIELGKREIEIEKVNLGRMDINLKREDMLRKDAEIKDKEQETLNRAKGDINAT